MRKILRTTLFTDGQRTLKPIYPINLSAASEGRHLFKVLGLLAYNA
jgi:hypothetical protein